MPDRVRVRADTRATAAFGFWLFLFVLAHSPKSPKPKAQLWTISAPSNSEYDLNVILIRSALILPIYCLAPLPSLSLSLSSWISSHSTRTPHLVPPRTRCSREPLVDHDPESINLETIYPIAIHCRSCKPPLHQPSRCVVPLRVHTRLPPTPHLSLTTSHPLAHGP